MFARYSVSSFGISFGTAPERLEELSAAVFQQIDSVKTNGPTQEDIDKVKETQRRGHETNLRENAYWLNQLIAYERSGLDIRDILTYEALIETLTLEWVQEAAQLYLRTDNYVQISLYPEEQPEEGGQD